LGFWETYDGTERVFVDEAGQWWVDIRHCLSKDDNDACQAILMRMEIPFGEKGIEPGKIPLNTTGQELEQVARSVVGWNIPTRDNPAEILPFHPLDQCRASLQALPQPVFATVAKRVRELNAPRKDAEKAKFRAGAGGSDPAGERGAADPAAVLDGAGPVAAAGSPAGP
jgi:hypothetical protein